MNIGMVCYASVGGSGTMLSLSRRAIEVGALPRGVTSVIVALRHGTVVGRGGRIRTTAFVGERSEPASTMGLFTRLPQAGVLARSPSR